LSIKNFFSSKALRGKIMIPFGLKLPVIVALIVIASGAAIAGLMAALIIGDFGKTAVDNNAAINDRSATVAEEKLYKIRSDGLLLLDITGSGEDQMPAGVHFFERIQDIVAVVAPGGNTRINQAFFRNHETDPDALLNWLNDETEGWERASRGEPVLRNAAVALGIPLVAMFFPWQERGLEEAVAIVFLPDQLADVFGDGQNMTVMVNEAGDILVHPDVSMVLANANMAASPLFAALHGGSGESVKLLYSAGGRKFYGAGRSLSFAGASVMSSIEYDLVAGRIQSARQRNVIIAFAAMFISFFIAWFLSRTVTIPVKKLIDATRKIEHGEFDLALQANTYDEIAVLTERFVQMGKGLNQLHEADELVGRFNNSEISARARNGELNLSGELKRVTMMYFDFSSISALYKKYDPADFLSQINSYFSKITDCVEKTFGVVDRVFGQRLIAIWGAPISSGGPATDAMNAVSAALLMRAVHWEINKGREEGSAPLFRMACGIHTGDLIAGGINHSGHTHYSFIGGALGHASHAATLNTAMSTDIIMTRAMEKLIGDQLVLEELPKTGEGEGHSDFFALINTKPRQPREKPQWPYTLEDVRESLGMNAHGGDHGQESK